MSASLRALLPSALLVLGACSGGPAPASPAPGPGSSTPDVSAPDGRSAAAAPTASATLYREDQADRGRRVFQDRCSECHYSSEMRGTQFQFEWERRTVGDLYEHLVETMPEDDPGSLTPDQYLEVVSYILRLNGFPSGGQELGTGGRAFEASLQAPAGAGEA